MISLFLLAAVTQPAASVRVAFDRHGETSVQVAGLADIGAGRKVTAGDPVRIASISKLVVALGVMRLVEQHRLDLDRPIVQLLGKPLDSYPDYKQTAGDLVRDQRWSAVTPRMLLSHTSGLANFASLEPDKKMHLHYAPGSRFAYSGEGLNLLQFVIEQREHKPLEELIAVAAQRKSVLPRSPDHCRSVSRPTTQLLVCQL